MILYKQKEAAALQKAAQGDFSNGETLIGEYSRRECFQLLYHPYFSGYFHYKLFGVLGDFREDRCTWWGFEAACAADENIAEAYEQPLRPWEVKSWLAENYGHFTDPDDFEYLIDILRASNRSGAYNYGRALEWLEVQFVRATTLVTRKPAKSRQYSSLVHTNDVSSILGTSKTYVALSPAELILCESFSLEEMDKLALQIGLINEQRHYCLGPRKLSALVGFCLALKEYNKLLGTIPELTAVVGPRYGVEIRTRKAGTRVADCYQQRTQKALRNLKSID